MKQRLAIAATLLKQPDLLILDEPTNGLDPAGIRDIRDMIRGLGETGVTVLLSSHILAEVQQVCHSVSIIGNGRTARLRVRSTTCVGDAPVAHVGSASPTPPRARRPGRGRLPRHPRRRPPAWSRAPSTPRTSPGCSPSRGSTSASSPRCGPTWSRSSSSSPTLPAAPTAGPRARGAACPMRLAARRAHPLPLPPRGRAAARCRRPAADRRCSPLRPAWDTRPVTADDLATRAGPGRASRPTAQQLQRRPRRLPRTTRPAPSGPALGRRLRATRSCRGVAGLPRPRHRSTSARCAAPGCGVGVGSCGRAADRRRHDLRRRRLGDRLDEQPAAVRAAPGPRSGRPRPSRSARRPAGRGASCWSSASGCRSSLVGRRRAGSRSRGAVVLGRSAGCARAGRRAGGARCGLGGYALTMLLRHTVGDRWRCCSPTRRRRGAARLLPLDRVGGRIACPTTCSPGCATAYESSTPRSTAPASRRLRPASAPCSWPRRRCYLGVLLVVAWWSPWSFRRRDVP